MSDDPLEEGLQHLERAAREMIQAGRSFLDAVESAVGNPAGVERFLRAMTGQQPGDRSDPGGTESGAGGPDEPDEDIPVE